MDLDTALAWAAERNDGVLITLRRDGRPQSSDIAYHLDGGVFHISVTAGRAKTHNMERDPRVVLHLTSPRTFSYLSFDATAELTPAAAAPDDDTVEQLIAYYRRVRGEEHPDWDDYRRAMVADRRLIVRVSPHGVVGMINQR